MRVGTAEILHPGEWQDGTRGMLVWDSAKMTSHPEQFSDGGSGIGLAVMRPADRRRVLVVETDLESCL